MPTYPHTPRGDVVDVLHGVSVPDPYRWLEDLDSQETQAWVQAQNELTYSYLEQIPARERIKQRLTELWDYARTGLPFKRGGRTFYTHNDGLQNQAVLFWLPAGAAGPATEAGSASAAEPRVLLDPNTLSDDGTVALTGYSASEDGALLAYGLSSAGSDWQEWRVREVESGQDHDDRVRWVKFGQVSWTRDGRGFFYSRFDEPQAGDDFKGTTQNQKIYYHRLGTPQSEDVLIYERPDHEDWYLTGEVTEDGRYLVIDVSHGTRRKNAVFYKDLQGDLFDRPVVELLPRFDAQYAFVGNDGPCFYLRTDLDAPLARVVAVDLRAPVEMATVVAESGDALQWDSLVGGRLLAGYLHDAHSLVRVYDKEGQVLSQVSLPGLGSAGGFGGRQDDAETFYWYTDFRTPAIVYRYDVESGTSTVFRRPELRFNPDDYVTEQVFCTSADGTRVPLFLTYKRGLARDGQNPTYLYGYGGFNISLTPGYSPAVLAWLEMGGLYAHAILRGGGEYGVPWHDGGKVLNKQNVFDDFFGAAEWLIAEGYTSTRKLAIGGGSNGGLLVGACMTQRPELFGACLPAVGVMDMLRYEKFTVGWAWSSDYGSVENEDEFRALLAYSPYHNLRPGTTYPATLVTTADHDDRVFPAHSFKFAAALQHAQAGDAQASDAQTGAPRTGAPPALIRIETRAGHGAGMPTSKQIETAADRWAFLVDALEMDA